jgi:NTE family protein
MASARPRRRWARPVAGALCQLSLLLFSGSLLAAQAIQSQEGAHRPRVGVVLSGGGARGAAHIGVLRVLEELRIPVDAVAGTSMGAVVGGLYASGLSAAEIERELLSLDWPAIFRDDIPREALSFRRKDEQRQMALDRELGIGLGGVELPGGLVRGHSLELMLRILLLPVMSTRDFHHLPIPFRVTATDMETGELVTLAGGDLPRAIRASMAVPAAFTPVEWDGRRLVDGGLLENLPLGAMGELHVDVVIAVDIGSDLQAWEGRESLFWIASQAATLVTREGTRRSLEQAPPQLLLRPDVAGFSGADFPRSDSLIRRGEAAARAEASTLVRWSLHEAGYREWREEIVARRGGAPTPGSVEIRGVGPTLGARVRSGMETRAGVPLDTAMLRRDIDGLYGWGEFDRVGFTLTGDGEDLRLVIQPEPKQLGANTFRFGLGLTDDLAGRGSFALRTQFVMMRLTPQGGDLRLNTTFGDHREVGVEFFQPLSARSPLFVRTQVAHQRRIDAHLESRTRLSHSVRRSRLAGGLGAHIGTWAEVSGTLAFEHVDAAPEGSSDEHPAFRGWQGFVIGSVEVDRMDDASFPQRGVLGRVEVRSSGSGWGEGPGYDQLSADLSWAWGRGRNSAVLSGAFGVPLRGEAPFHDRFRLGGLLRLSGLGPDAVLGQTMLFGRVLFFRSLGTAGGVRVGGAFELGDAWPGEEEFTLSRLRPGVTALTGMKTLLGSVALGVGVTEGGRWAGHLLLGRLPY